MPWCLPREQRHPAAFLKPPRQQRQAPQVTALGPGTQDQWGTKGHSTERKGILKWAKYWPQEQLGLW